MSQEHGTTACGDCPLSGGCDHAGGDRRECCQSAGLRRVVVLWNRPAIRRRLPLAAAAVIVLLTAASLAGGTPTALAWPAWCLAAGIALWWSAPAARSVSPWGQAVAAATLLAAAPTPAWPLAVAAAGFALRLDGLQDTQGVAPELKLVAAVALAAGGAILGHAAPLTPALGAALAAALGLRAGEGASAQRRHQALLSALAQAEARPWAEAGATLD